MEILIINNQKTVFNWQSKKERSYEDLELIAKKVNGNKLLEKVAIFTLAYSMFKQKIVMATATGITTTTGLDPLGWKLLRLIRKWAKWVLILICILEILKSGMNGESKKTLPIVIKYLTIYIALFIVPEIYDAVESSFPN